jgi:hypothetical protein
MVFKVNRLDRNNEIEHVYVYGADEKDESIFSDSERKQHAEDKSEIHYLKDQQIHLDDSIRVIKNKILRGIGAVADKKNAVDRFSYKEIYMFGYKTESKKTESKRTESKRTESKKILVPIGSKFTGKPDVNFAINPFECNNVATEDTAFYMFDNLLLFQFGELVDDTIYLCLASSVFEYAKSKRLDESYFAKLYYPQLYKDGIRGESARFMRKEELIDESNKSLNDDVWKLYDTVTAFHDIYNKREPGSDFKYENEGINYFNLGIKTDFVNLLPLDSIFKTIHATKNMPFIKYNQGFRRESLYRLYSEKTAVNGHKIPYLPKAEIMKLSKEFRKTGEITIYAKSINLKIVFKKDGSMQVQSEPTKPINTSELDSLLKTGMNPIIREINGFIESTGYKIREYESMNDEFMEVFEIKYTSSIKLDRKMDISTNKGCISSIFNIISASQSGADMRFKRVDNYHNMDRVDELIYNERKKHSEIYDIVQMLIEEADLTEEAARMRVMAIYSNVNDDDDAFDNSGFPVKMELIPSEKKMVFQIENITAIEYVDILKLYIDSIIRMYQNPKSTSVKIAELCKKTINYENVDKPAIENVVAPVEIHRSFDTDFFGKTELEEEDEEDDDEDFSGMDIEGGGLGDDEDTDEIIEKNVDGMDIKNPNPFHKRILDRDSPLILTRKVGKFNPYSRTCPPADNRQPVILNKDELDKTKKESYFGEPLEHRGNYYICPRYWSLKTDTSLTQSEVDEILKTNKDAIIPPGEKKVPKGAFIYEFNEKDKNKPSEHRDSKNNYIPHYPGLQMDSHPDGIGVPCCFSKQDKKNQPDLKNDDKNRHFFDQDKYPVAKNRRGFLPIPAQRFFKFNNANFYLSGNLATLKPGAPCLVRYGVEQNTSDSFIGCFADIYKDIHKLKGDISNQAMREIIKDAVSLDDFLKYSLVPIFRESGAQPDLTDKLYEKSNFLRFAKMDREIEKTYVSETVGAYENFRNFLTSSPIIDHTYMWEIITSPHPKLIPNGLNLAILKITGDDSRIEYICPLNQSEPSKDTLILLKHDEFYEPIYLCESKGAGKFDDTRLFNSDTPNELVKGALVEIQRLSAEYCKPKDSMPKKYKFKRANIDLHKTIDLLRKAKFDVLQQIVNYQSKAIGVMVHASNGGMVFVPCKPSPMDLNLNLEITSTAKIRIHIDFIDNMISNDYETTVKTLKDISEKTSGKIRCLPVNKLVNRKRQIFGLLTETNQFMKIDIRADVVDEIPSIDSSDYIAADTSKREPDKERVKIVHNIKLESQFYSTFRSTVRTLLSYYENRDNKSELIDIMSGNVSRLNYDKIKAILMNISKDSIVFNEYSPEQISRLNEITSCREEKPYCDEKSRLIIPNKNLNTGIDNEALYYGRLTDELVRFRRIRSIMLEPVHYLNLSNINFKVNDTEILLLDSAMNSGYLNDLNVFDVSEYIKNITFDIAKPDIMEVKYVNVDEKM